MRFIEVFSSERVGVIVNDSLDIQARAYPNTGNMFLMNTYSLSRASGNKYSSLEIHLLLHLAAVMCQAMRVSKGLWTGDV